MAANSSTKAVVMALVGNAFLTVLKFVTFAFSGSGAMFSEAIHSFADTGNQALLYVGIRRSEKPPNRMFHYGYGGERFFFALMSAVGIFVLGCGFTLYHGIHSLLHPPELEFGIITPIVLVISFLVDGLVMWKAIQAINGVRGETPFVQYLRRSSDPTVVAVLLEDGVACLGVLVAMSGIGLAWLTGSAVWDSLATIVIGLMMGAIAIVLGYQNRSLILGKALPRDVELGAIEYLAAQPTVEKVRAVKSRVVGADRFTFKAEVDWNGAALAEALLDWVEQHAPDMATQDGRADFARKFGEKITEALGDEIDRIEVELQKRYPELVYMDFESD